jgi:hypothetical protein
VPSARNSAERRFWIIAEALTFHALGRSFVLVAAGLAGLESETGDTSTSGPARLKLPRVRRGSDSPVTDFRLLLGDDSPLADQSQCDDLMWSNFEFEAMRTASGN